MFVARKSPATFASALGQSVAFCGLTLIGLVALFIVLQALSIGAMPEARIIKFLSKAVQAGVLTEDNFPTSPYGHKSLNYDKYTDCIALSTNLGNDDVPLIRRVASTPYVDFHLTPEKSPCKLLVDGLRDKTVRADKPYFRYWHGHQIYLRPLLSVTSLANVHIINAVLLFTALGVLIAYMVRTFGLAAAPVLIIPLAACSNILTVPGSTVHALTWIWAFVSLSIAFNVFLKRETTAPKTVAMVFGFGCVAVFFDVLFSPPLAPTLMAFFAIYIGLERGRDIRAVLDGAVVGFAWFAGFSLAWMSKWAFATAVLGWDAVKPGLFDAIKVRSFGDESLDATKRVLFGATRTAFEHQDGAVILWSIAVALVLVAVALVRGARWPALLRIGMLLTPLAVPIVWVEVLRDHSLLHPEFAARSFVVYAIIPLLAALTLYRGQGVSDYAAARASSTFS